MDSISDYLIWLIVAHLIADWIFQNDWMAKYKVSLLHPAAWVHGAIHLAACLFVVSLPYALLIAVLHMLIDTRIPLQWWQKFYRQTVDGDAALHVAIWGDQVAHIAVIALVVLIHGV